MTFQEHMERAELFLEQAEESAAALKQWMADWRKRQQPKERDDDDIYDEDNW